jgi:hypothetical protein
VANDAHGEEVKAAEEKTQAPVDPNAAAAVAAAAAAEQHRLEVEEKAEAAARPLGE